MLYKMSKVLTSGNTGVKVVKLFTIYSKKRYAVLKQSGWCRGSIKKTKRKKGFMIGKRVKGYITSVKLNRLKVDHSNIIGYKNKIFIKHKKLNKKKYNYGYVYKNILHKKFLYKFATII